MKRRNLTPLENSSNIEFPEVGVSHMILREHSEVDEFYHEKTLCPDDRNESVSIVDPIRMLFNQTRIENMGQMAAQQFIDSFSCRSNSLQELRKQCSDDDLMSLIKSKHLQSPAEILSWCRFMNENINEFNKEVQRLVDEQKHSAEETTSDVTSIDSNSNETL